MKTLNAFYHPQHKINMMRHELVKDVLLRRGFDMRSYSGYFEMYHLLKPEAVIQEHFHNQVENQIHLMQDKSSHVLSVHNSVLKRLEQIKSTVIKPKYMQTSERIFKMYTAQMSSALEDRSSFHKLDQFTSSESTVLNTLSQQFLNQLARNNPVKDPNTYINRLLETKKHNEIRKKMSISNMTHFQLAFEESASKTFLNQYLRHSNIRQLQAEYQSYLKQSYNLFNVPNSVEKRLSAISFSNLFKGSKNEPLSFVNNQWNKVLNKIVRSTSLSLINREKYDSLSKGYGLDVLWHSLNKEGGKSYINNVSYLNEMFYIDHGSYLNDDSYFGEILLNDKQLSFKKQIMKRMFKTITQNQPVLQDQKEIGFKHVVNQLNYLLKSMKHQHTTMQNYSFMSRKKQIRKQTQFVENVIDQVFLKTEKKGKLQQRKNIRNTLKSLLKDQRFFTELMRIQEGFSSQNKHILHKTKTSHVNGGHTSLLYQMTQTQLKPLNYTVDTGSVLDTQFYNRNLMSTIGDEVKRFNTAYQMASTSELNNVVEHFIENNQVLLNQELYHRFKESNNIDTYSRQFLSTIDGGEVENYNPFADFNFNTVLNYVDLNRQYDMQNDTDIHRVSYQTEEKTQQEVQTYESIAKQKMLYQLKKTFEKNLVKYYRSQFLDQAEGLQSQMTRFKTRMDYRTDRYIDRDQQKQFDYSLYRNVHGYEPIGLRALKNESAWIEGNIWSPLVGGNTLTYEMDHSNHELNMLSRNLVQNEMLNKHVKHMQKRQDNEPVFFNRRGYHYTEKASAFNWIQEKWTRLNSVLNGEEAHGYGVLGGHRNMTHEQVYRSTKEEDKKSKAIFDLMNLGTNTSYNTQDVQEIYKIEKNLEQNALKEVTASIEERIEKLFEEIQVIREQSNPTINVDHLSNQILKRLNQKMKIDRQRKGVI